MSTGSIEEKIIQRQLSKEGLQSIIDNKEEVRIEESSIVSQKRRASLHESGSF